MNIILSRLVLRNFKGVREFVADFSQYTEVHGDNATGKTTLFDAFSWLMFDKDSQNKKDFDIKTLDTSGKPLHGLNHEVEGTLVADGKSVILRKVYSEKWTKKRGSATQEFSGHTTDYFIDGVPVKLKEYKDRIDSLIDEHIFKLLTSPTYFNEQVDWKARRKILLEICGDVSDAEVIASSDALSRLPGILNGHSIEDHRKIVAARCTEVNKELDKIPVRIDEAERSKPDVAGLSENDLKMQVVSLSSDIQAKTEELTRLQSGGEAAVHEKHLREIEGEMLQIKNRVQVGSMDAVNNQRQEVQRLSGLGSDINFQIQRIQRQISENDSNIERKKNEAQRLREEWNSVNAQEFIHAHDENCPTCGQALPEETVQSAHDKALADFNRRKSERLEEITNRGKQAMSEVARLEQENQKLTAEKEDLSAKLRRVDADRLNAQTKLDELQAKVQDFTKDPEYVAKQQEYQDSSNKLAAVRSSSLDDIERVRRELMDLRDELRRKESVLAGFSQIQVQDKRIADLKQQERDLAKEYERLQEELYLTEEFIRAKVSLLESKINSKFKYARFKLFDQQINGGIAETCETLYQGVPYGSGLNNAARINVGLDIINTLSEHYGLTAPIFIDNRESVTKLIDVHSQVISLIVSESDKKLRIETADQMKEAV